VEQFVHPCHMLLPHSGTAENGLSSLMVRIDSGGCAHRYGPFGSLVGNGRDGAEVGAAVQHREPSNSAVEVTSK
jgi:hypothetical protein